MFFKKYTLGAEPKSDFLTLVVNEVAHKEDFFFYSAFKGAFTFKRLCLECFLAGFFVNKNI